MASDAAIRNREIFFMVSSSEAAARSARQGNGDGLELAGILAAQLRLDQVVDLALGGVDRVADQRDAGNAGQSLAQHIDGGGVAADGHQRDASAGTFALQETVTADGAQPVRA